MCIYIRLLTDDMMMMISHCTSHIIRISCTCFINDTYYDNSPPFVIIFDEFCKPFIGYMTMKFILESAHIVVRSYCCAFIWLCAHIVVQDEFDDSGVFTILVLILETLKNLSFMKSWAIFSL